MQLSHSCLSLKHTSSVLSLQHYFVSSLITTSNVYRHLCSTIIPSKMKFFLAALLAMTCITLRTSLTVATGGDLYEILVSALDAPDKPNTMEQNQALKRVARNSAQWLMGAEQYNTNNCSYAQQHAEETLQGEIAEI